MKKSKGITFVEIIVSVAILGIICIFLIQSFVEQHRFLYETRNFTEQSFAGMKTVEQMVQNVKDQLLDDDPLTPTLTPAGTPSDDSVSAVQIYNIFGKAVEAYKIEVSVVGGVYSGVTAGKRTFTTIVGAVRPAAFEVPSIDDLKITLYDNNIEVDYAFADSNVRAKATTVSIQDIHLHLMTRYQWYVSRDGFNISNKGVATGDPLVGLAYPVFPQDYMLLSGANTDTVDPVAENVSGRHLILSAIPAAMSGKMGPMAVSNAVFVPGRPDVAGLMVHLDASLIGSGDVNNAGGVDYLKNWPDHSGYANHAIQATSTKMPIVMIRQIGNVLVSPGEYRSVYSRSVKFDGIDDFMQITTNPQLQTDNFTVFAVMSTGDVTRSALLSKGTVSVFDGANFHALYGPGLENNMMYVLGMDRDGFSTIDDVPVSGIDPGKLGVNGDPISIGQLGVTGSNIEVAEILIYDHKLSTADFEKVRDYLMRKYGLPF